MDFWPRGVYHRAKKIMRGPRSKKGTSLRFGSDGFYRKRKKVAQVRHLRQRHGECLNYERFCRRFGSCDGQTCEYAGKG